MKNFYIDSDLDRDPFEVLQYNTLALAFVGDAVHSLYVRTRLVLIKDIKVNDLQKKTSGVVRATSQSEFLESIMDTLSESEIALVKRARNTHTNNIAKSATAKEYKLSTAFEALIGYLYLSGQVERMNELLEKSFEERLC